MKNANRSNALWGRLLLPVVVCHLMQVATTECEAAVVLGDSLFIRGGYTDNVAPSNNSNNKKNIDDEEGDELEEEYDFRVPKVELNHMALALRWTGELNRKLHAGTAAVDIPMVDLAHNYGSTPSSSSSYANPQHLWRGGSTTLRIRPSLGDGVDRYQISSSDSSNSEASLTMFHAKLPRTKSSSPSNQHKQSLQRRGAARWGPSLPDYLRSLCKVVNFPSSSSSLELALALTLIYLDRACSVETPRSNGFTPCPYCTPRTVHRLTLAAFLLAVQVVYGPACSLEQCYAKLNRTLLLGTPYSQLQQMIEWMKGALGDPGLLVTCDQMNEWTSIWEARFPPSPPPLHPISSAQS